MGVTVFRYALRRGLLQPFSLITNSVLPIALVVFGSNEYFGTGEGARGYFTLALLMLFGAFLMAGSIQSDKMDGVLVRILVGPITFRSYLIQNFFAGLFPMVLLSSVIGVLGIVIHGWPPAFALAVALCYILLSATSIGLSFVWSCLFKSREGSIVAFSLILTLMASLGGLMISVRLLPPVIRRLGSLFPAQWAARGFEELIAYETATARYWLSMLVLVLFTAALLLYGSRRRIV
jgi:ABC-type multidrug transport system permease subunit